MFSDVGREIKLWAKIFVWCDTAVAAVLGGLIASPFYEDYSIVWLFAVALAALVGYLIGRFSALLLYSYGEIVDGVTEIRRKVCDGK